MKYVLQEYIHETTHMLTDWNQEYILHCIKTVTTN